MEREPLVKVSIRVRKSVKEEFDRIATAFYKKPGLKRRLLEAALILFCEAFWAGHVKVRDNDVDISEAVELLRKYTKY